MALGQEAFDHLVGLSAGDARQALNVLESAVSIAESEGARDEAGHVAPRLVDVEAAAQQRALAYDRAGDGHYDTVSAFIKSIRGNDPDAALYWLASMIAAGEDPRFIARRLIVCASEDVGLADPRAMEIAVAAARALDWVGLPEAQYSLAEATVYLAAAPKSNRAGRAYWAAMEDVLDRGSLAVPMHLRNASPPGHAPIRHRSRLPLSARLRGRGRRLSSTCPTSCATVATTSRPKSASSLASGSDLERLLEAERLPATDPNAARADPRWTR